MFSKSNILWMLGILFLLYAYGMFEGALNRVGITTEVVLIGFVGLGVVLVILLTILIFRSRAEEKCAREKNARFVEFQQELSKLRLDLEGFEHSADSLTDIVSFFDIVSRWQDRGFLSDITTVVEAGETLEYLNALQIHFYRAGRQPYGW